MAHTPSSAPGFTDSSADTGTGVGTPAFSPLYQQIKALILQSLQAGEWKPAEVIPSEHLWRPMPSGMCNTAS